MTGEHNDLYRMTMGELTSEAYRVGLATVAHMSVHELIEAIGQQRETNEVEMVPEPDVVPARTVTVPPQEARRPRSEPAPVEREWLRPA